MLHFSICFTCQLWGQCSSNLPIAAKAVCTNRISFTACTTVRSCKEKPPTVEELPAVWKDAKSLTSVVHRFVQWCVSLRACFLMTHVGMLACWLQDRMKIAKELGSGAFGRIYQLAATCDGTKDHFVSMKFMASQRTPPGPPIYLKKSTHYTDTPNIHR